MHANQLVQSDYTQFNGNLSQGRTTEVRKKPKVTGNGISIQATKSAVLHTTSSKERREIKRIPSKTKVNNDGKTKKRKQVATFNNSIKCMVRAAKKTN